MGHAAIRVTRSVVDGFLYSPNPMSAAGLRLYRAFHRLREQIVPSRRRARHEDREFDARFGVKTKALIRIDPSRVVGENGFGAVYRAVRPPRFREALAHFQINHEDFVFIDFGSGMGRALLLASDYPFKEIVGVEFSPDLHLIAEENIRRYKSATQRCKNITSICTDATLFPIPKERAIFYFNDPFRAEVMRSVLSNIHISVEESPRELFFIYLNPRAPELLNTFNLHKSYLFTSFKS
jgi:hypothetical protein